MNNIKIENIVNKIPEYEPFKKEDEWNKILVRSRSTYKGDKKDITAKALEDFSLASFDEIENIQRKDRFKNKYGYLYKGDIFACDETMFEYLTIIPNRKPVIERVEENV